MKFSLNDIQIIPVAKKVAGVTPIVRRTDEVRVKMINSIARYVGFDDVTKEHIFYTIIGDTKFDIVVNDYMPTIVFATYYNDKQPLYKPSVISKPKELNKLTPFWSHLYDGMEIKGYTDFSTGNKFIINTSKLIITAEKYRVKWNKEFNKHRANERANK